MTRYCFAWPARGSLTRRGVHADGGGGDAEIAGDAEEDHGHVCYATCTEGSAVAVLGVEGLKVSILNFELNAEAYCGHCCLFLLRREDLGWKSAEEHYHVVRLGSNLRQQADESGRCRDSC